MFETWLDLINVSIDKYMVPLEAKEIEGLECVYWRATTRLRLQLMGVFTNARLRLKATTIL